MHSSQKYFHIVTTIDIIRLKHQNFKTLQDWSLANSQQVLIYALEMPITLTNDHWSNLACNQPLLG
jgi:hypothetical protein